MVFVVLLSTSIVERPWMGLVALAQPLLKKGVSKYRPTKDILVYNFYDFVGGTTVCPSVNILIVYNMENIHQLCIFDCMHCRVYVCPTCSSTNALTGEGLEEAVDWLTGKEFPKVVRPWYNNAIFMQCAENVRKQLQSK